ncbi:MAG: DNA polymerase III subunit delta [bacterium]
MPKRDPNILLLTGGDALQLEKNVAEIVKKRFGEAEVDWVRLDAGAGETRRAIEEVRTSSLFTPNKVVLLGNLEKIPKDTPKIRGNLEIKSDLEILAGALPRLGGDILFLMLGTDIKDVPKALIQALGKERVREVPKPTPAQIRAAVLKRCADQQVTMEKDALEWFMNACGDNAETARRELDKLLLWAEEEKAITREMCRRLVQTEEEEDIWAITNAVAARDTVLALKTLDRLLAQEDEEIAITGRLIGNFKAMYHCKALEADKVPFAAWAKRVGRQGYALKIAHERSQKFTLEALRRDIHLLRVADLDLKGGKPTNPPVYQRLVLERLILDLCQAQPACTAA